MSLAERTIPPGAIASGSLPPPSTWTPVEGRVRNYSDWQRGTVLLHGTPDVQVRPKLWELTWSSVPAAVANAVWAHFRDHRGSWLWRFPRTSTTYVARYAATPQINWQTRHTADVQCTLELVLARN